MLLAETHQPRPVQSPATFTPLSFGEIPEQRDAVGIDAEFVTLNQEEAEVKSDGTHTTLKPSQLSVARITVTRGWVRLKYRTPSLYKKFLYERTKKLPFLHVQERGN